MAMSPEPETTLDDFPSRSAAGSPDPAEVHADLKYLTHDPKLVSKIMKKRQEEMARRTKLLNTRTFRHGVPHHILDDQVAAKKGVAEGIKAEDDYHDRYRVISDQVAQVCETIRHEATRERQKAVTAYSLENCRKEQRREFDLSDPNLIKTERPARDGDNDTRLGASSIQTFEGEDFLAQNRKKEAVSATREWLAYQMAEKKENQDRERDVDRLHNEAMMTANQVRGLCERADIEEAIAEKRAEAADNKALAATHAARKHAARSRDAQAVQAHVDHEMSSERMMELVDYKLGCDGRLMKGEYKRLSLEEEQGVYDTNARLMLEKQARTRAEKSGDYIERDTAFVGDHIRHALETEKARVQRTRRAEMEEFNKSLAQQKKDFDVLEKQAYKSYEHVETYTSTANLC
jgi:hypothetical protein